MATRKLGNWIGGYLQYTEGLVSPVRFRTWAGIAAISAALGRRVYTTIGRQKQYANLYTVLVAEPGKGKGNALKFLKPLMRAANIKLAPDGVTNRAFLSVLEASHTYDIQAGVQQVLARSAELTAVIDEMSIFIPPGDLEFQDTLLHIYDNPSFFHHKTQHYGENQIEEPTFSFIAGTTPDKLKRILSDEALEGGFPARLILVFSDESVKVNLWEVRVEQTDLKEALEQDLASIKKIEGEFPWQAEAAAELQDWYDKGMPPTPTDRRFKHYITRRLTHITKLCLIIAVAKSDDRIITLADLEAAKTVMLEAEQYMSGAISALGANPLLGQQQLAIKIINAHWEKYKQPLREHVLRRLLSREVPPQYLNSILDMLTTARWVQHYGDRPMQLFWPRGMKWSGLQEGEELKEDEVPE